MHVIPYDADFECEKGHRFTAAVHFDHMTGGLQRNAQATCPVCYAAWIEANVPKGRQVSEPRQVPPSISYL